MKFYTEKDASCDILKGAKIAIIGYGSQGRAQAQCMKDSGLDIIVGIREGKSASLAQSDGMKTLSVEKAVIEADIIHILLPDEVQGKIYREQIEKHLSPKKTLCFSHGFSIHFKRIVPPIECDVIMVSPRSPGPTIRSRYLEGKGVLCSIAIHQDNSGYAHQKALALSKACGFLRVGAMECSFEEETIGDLFGEQAVLCGGVSELIIAAYNTLVKSGHPKEMAYLDCLHELKLLVDLINEKGIEGMYSVVSRTAEFGGRKSGKRIIDDSVRENMEKVLADIKSNKFAEEWMRDCDQDFKLLNALRSERKTHSIEQVGKELRKRMGIEK